MITVLLTNLTLTGCYNLHTGRTGRVCDGVCIRMMTRQHFQDQPEFDEPQMRIAPLDKLLLQVKYVGMFKFTTFCNFSACENIVNLLVASERLVCFYNKSRVILDTSQLLQ